MNWIRLRTILRSHAKTKRIMAATGLGLREVLGALALLWMLAEHEAVRGRLKGWTEAMIDQECHTPGLYRALRDRNVDWIREVKGGLLLPRFGRHNVPAKDRAEGTRVRVRKHRAKMKALAEEVEASGHEDVTPPVTRYGNEKGGSVTRYSSVRVRGREQNRTTTTLESEKNQNRTERGAVSSDTASRDVVVVPEPVTFNRVMESVGIVRMLRAGGVEPESAALRLAEHPNATPERLRWLLDHQIDVKFKPGGRGGWLRRAIEKGWNPPREYWSEPEVLARQTRRLSKRRDELAALAGGGS